MNKKPKSKRVADNHPLQQSKLETIVGGNATAASRRPLRELNPNLKNILEVIANRKY